MPLTDLAAFIDPGFDLPIRGKTYRVPAPSAKDGLFLQALIDAGESLLVAQAVSRANKQVLADDEDERHTYQVALGPVYQQLVDDDVPWPIVKHAGMTALLHWTRGPDAAERYWCGFGQGKAPEQAEDEASPTPSDTPPPGR